MMGAGNDFLSFPSASTVNQAVVSQGFRKPRKESDMGFKLKKAVKLLKNISTATSGAASALDGIKTASKTGNPERLSENSKDILNEAGMMPTK